MKLRAFMMMGLGVVMLAGCQNKNQQQTAHSEEPYSSGYSSLDSMDAAPGATQTPYTPVYTPVQTEPAPGTSYCSASRQRGGRAAEPEWWAGLHGSERGFALRFGPAVLQRSGPLARYLGSQPKPRARSG